MKKLFKRVPEKNYESSYELSDALIERIAADTAEAWAQRTPMTAIQVAVALGAGEVIMLASPFTTDPTEVRWSLESELSYFDDSENLHKGEGDLWMVRVVSSADDCDWVDLPTRAPTMEEAADKAEAHARRHPDMYFEDSPPTYHAMRHDTYRIDEEDECYIP